MHLEPDGWTGELSISKVYVAREYTSSSLLELGLMMLTKLLRIVGGHRIRIPDAATLSSRRQQSSWLREKAGDEALQTGTAGSRYRGSLMACFCPGAMQVTSERWMEQEKRLKKRRLATRVKCCQCCVKTRQVTKGIENEPVECWLFSKLWVTLWCQSNSRV